MILRISFVIFFIIVGSGCGSKNLFDCDGGLAGSRCSKLTKYEEARRALDDGDLDTAIDLLLELKAEQPDIYERYPLLAAAYAGRAGLDIVNIVTADFSGERSLLQTMDEFIPTPVSVGAAYDAILQDMNAANLTLLDMPPQRRASTSSDKYAQSTVLQLTLYQSAYAVMYLNKFTYSSSGYDPSLLASMTPADAAVIINALVLAGSAGGGAAGSIAESSITAIQAQSGANDAERLAAWSQSDR